MNDQTHTDPAAATTAAAEVAPPDAMQNITIAVSEEQVSAIAEACRAKIDEFAAELVGEIRELRTIIGEGLGRADGNVKDVDLSRRLTAVEAKLRHM